MRLIQAVEELASWRSELGHLLGQSRETGSSLALGLLEGVALCLQRGRNAGEIRQSCLLTCVNNIQVVPFGLGQR